MTDKPLYWPRMIVSGEQLSAEQTNELLLRTNAWCCFKCNDADWAGTVADIAGLELTELGYPTEESYAELIARWDVLELGFIHNARIACTWINGPRGWCEWSGRIESRECSVGPWPRLDKLDLDWQAVAHAFPFLVLNAQVLDEAGAVARQWHLQHGRARTVTPGPLLLTPPPYPEEHPGPGGGDERGVSVERLEAAVAQVNARYSAGAFPGAAVSGRGAGTR